MNNSTLNAKLFSGLSSFNHNEFESILKCCVDIYNQMLSTNCKVENSEEKIRDYFFHFLDDDNYRRRTGILENYHFEREPQENSGFLDIKIKTIKPYISTKAFYIIECKRLNSHNLTGNTGLNAEYVKNGICRFVTEYYSSYFNCNAMFGFIVDTVNIQTDIVDNINKILNKNFINAQSGNVNAHAVQQMQYTNLANNFSYSYLSIHIKKSKHNLELYHLMFDFSKNIK